MVAGGTEIVCDIVAHVVGCHAEGENLSKAAVFVPKRVLVLSKTTRFDYEKRRYANLTPQQFRSLLKWRGSDYSEMEKKHLQHQAYINMICTALSCKGVDTRVVDREGYTESAVAWADAIFTAGGDGTFLIAAGKVRDGKVVIGFNTDPIGSEGHLCITRKSDEPVRDVIEKLFRGSFSWIWRRRIRVKILKWVQNNEEVSEAEEDLREKSDKIRKARLFRTDSFDPQAHLLALNDVFVAESHAARVSCYDIQIDDGPKFAQKSSGITICTGTGSTSWNYNINRISEEHVSEILSVMRSVGVISEMPHDNVTAEICRRFNQKLVFNPQSSKLAFSVRDPVFNATFPTSVSRGFASRIWIRSRCSDAHLVLDGGVSVPFNYGSEVLLESRKEDALRSVVFA